MSELPASLPGIPASFLWLDQPNAIIETIKRAEDGDGLITFERGHALKISVAITGTGYISDIHVRAAHYSEHQLPPVRALPAIDV